MHTEKTNVNICLKICMFNERSLINKFSVLAVLEALAASEVFHIIGVLESWITHKIETS